MLISHPKVKIVSITLVIAFVALMAYIFYSIPETDDKIISEVPKGEEVSLDGVENKESGIMGKVLLGPICPVMRDPPDPECNDKLFETTLALATEDGSKIIKTFSSDKQGLFKVTASPGRYTIVSGDKTKVFPHCGSEVIEVKKEQFTETNVSCDTGIR